MGKFVDHRVETEIHDKIGENLPPGSAGIIAVFDEAQRLAVEQALAGSLLKSVVQSDKEGVEALKDSLAEAMGKFSPDRTVLPIPDRGFGGTIGRTMDQSVADWTIVPGPKAPDNAPNVLICLIDDAGFGQPETFGGAIRTPNMTRVQEQGVTYNRFSRHGAVLADAGGVVDGPQPPSGGVRVDRGVSGAVSGVHRGAAPQLLGAAADPERERLRHGRVWQVAPDPGQRTGGSGTVRPLAAVMGIRPLLGIPERRRRSVRPDHHRGQHHARRPARQGRKAVLLP